MTHLFLRFFAAQSKYQFVDNCDPTESSTRFLEFPFWYEYLPGHIDSLGKCVPTFNWHQPESLWGIGLAVIEILLRVVILVTVGFIIYGGFQYMTSTGEPDKTKAAKDTILNALIGMVIAIIATAIVSFIGNKIN